MTIKSRLLELLEQNKGQVISGEAAAETLACTRAAIWKAVKSLREDGYRIDAGTNKGYCLAVDSHRISAEAIRLHLREEIPVQVFDRLDSTNREARRQLASGEASPGKVILARQQLQGRGRRGRSFYSPEGGIYLSMILRPEATLQESLLITTSAATAVYLAVKEVCRIDLSIKWVNDLYWEQRKVCGILTEAITDFESGEIDYVILGIGLNVIPTELPEDLREIVGFVGSEEQNWDANALIASIIMHLREETKTLQLSSVYCSRNCIPGHRILIRDGDKERCAEALEILQDGTLLIREEDGTERALHYGEVSVLPVDV